MLVNVSPDRLHLFALWSPKWAENICMHDNRPSFGERTMIWMWSGVGFLFYLGTFVAHQRKSNILKASCKRLAFTVTHKSQQCTLGKKEKTASLCVSILDFSFFFFFFLLLTAKTAFLFMLKNHKQIYRIGAKYEPKKVIFILILFKFSFTQIH